MATITNKTRKALSISLPGGKKLRLGPLNSAEISPKAVDHPAVQKLVDAGEVDISDLQQRSKRPGGGGRGSPPASGGQGHGGSIRQTGDR